MSRIPRRRTGVPLAASAVTAALLPLALTTPAVGAEPAPAEVSCQPTAQNLPVCPAAALVETATFVDPTARIVAPGSVTLGERVYVAPFAVLAAGAGTPITIGTESNVQDNVRVHAAVPRPLAARLQVEELGLSGRSGVEIGERVILAHGSEVRGPAQIGVESSAEQPDAEQPDAEQPDAEDPGAEDPGAEGAGGEESAQPEMEIDTISQATPHEDSGVFLSFGAQVDGAIIERDTALSALSRVGPGVRLRSGLVVLPGKNVTTQAEADDPALGKVRPLVETDVAFNEGVVEVNVGLAREYTRLAREERSAVFGINLDPGGNEFNQNRDAPTVESDLCTGPEVREPDFRNRIIGDVCFEDSLLELDQKLGSAISIRADEGGPFGIGTVTEMGDRVVFHALEGSQLRVGNRVDYGFRSIVHGGGRPQVDPTTGLAAATTVGNDVVLGSRSVVFRSLLRNGTRVGFKSAVVGSETELGQEIPDRVIYANDDVFGPVEW